MRSFFSIAGVILIAFIVLLQAGCAKRVQTTEQATTAKGTEEAPKANETRPPQNPLREESVTSPPPPAESELKKAPAEEATSLEDVFFDFDKWTLRPEATATLEQDARWLSNHPEATIQIEGHCDERGTTEYNLVLGERRAKAVMSYLANRGVTAKHLTVISYGGERPFCSEHDEVCYQKNRRAHFVKKGS